MCRQDCTGLMLREPLSRRLWSLPVILLLMWRTRWHQFALGAVALGGLPQDVSELLRCLEPKKREPCLMFSSIFGARELLKKYMWHFLLCNPPCAMEWSEPESVLPLYWGRSVRHIPHLHLCCRVSCVMGAAGGKTGTSLVLSRWINANSSSSIHWYSNF